MQFFYVYILQSERDQTYYIGFTTDLKKRLQQHNTGRSTYTKTKAPYRLVWYGAFLKKEQAMQFEKYLKSSSGYAFSRKRFL